LNLDALIGEGLFEDLLIAQHIHHTATAVLGAGAEVGHGDADFLEVGRLYQPGQGGAASKVIRRLKGSFMGAAPGGDGVEEQKVGTGLSKLKYYKFTFL
jgi:hypothetical protein